METINGLIEFIYVAENKSFSSAALALKVSKSHISKQITKLEHNLQVTLLIRTTRKMTLTDSGTILYEKSRHLFSDLEEIYAEVTQKQNQPTGTLKIGVAGAFAEEHLSQCFSSFLKEHPRIKIEMLFSERFVDIVEENFDLVVRYGNLENSSLISKKIARRKEFICANPEYINLYGQPENPKDLTGHNCLIGQNDNWSFITKGKKQNIKVTGSWKSNNGRALTTAVRNGLGIAKLPAVYVLDAIKSGELVSLLENHTEKVQDIWILYPPKRHLPQRVRLLIDYLDEFLQENYKNETF